MVVVDEASSVKKGFFFRVVLPVIPVNGTALIGISSPKGPSNWFTRFIGLRDRKGNQLFMSFAFQTICATCRKLEPAKMVTCSHVKDQTPLHLDQGKRDILSVAYEKMGMSEEFQQEHMGKIARSSLCAFSERQIRYIAEKSEAVHSREDVAFNVKSVIMTLDPNGGGSNRSGLIIGYMNERTTKFVVCIFFPRVWCGVVWCGVG